MARKPKAVKPKMKMPKMPPMGAAMAGGMVGKYPVESTMPMAPTDMMDMPHQGIKSKIPRC